MLPYGKNFGVTVRSKWYSTYIVEGQIVTGEPSGRRCRQGLEFGGFVWGRGRNVISKDRKWERA